MKKLLAALAFCVALPSAALAGTGTITVKDSLGNTKTFDVVTDGSGNFVSMTAVCDGSAAAQCAAVKAASTAAVATDPSLVVAISPNNALGVKVTGNTGAAMDAAGQNVASPANELLTGCQFNTTPTTITTTNMSPVQCDNAGNTLVNVKAALPTGTNVIGKAGIDQTTVGTTNGVTLVQSTTNGWSPILENALTTTVQTVKASAGELGGYYCWNSNAAVSYVQIFDISGTVTLGTSTPKWSIGIPPTSAANLEFTNGINFASAIKVAATTTATGLTAPLAAIDCNFAFK